MKLRDTTIRKVSFLLFLFSFLVIIIIDSYYEPPFYPLENITIKDLNKNIKTAGEIESQLLLSETLFLTVKENNSTIEIIGFYAKEKFDPNSNVEIIGKVSMNNKKLQIIASEIRVIP